MTTSTSRYGLGLAIVMIAMFLVLAYAPATYAKDYYDLNDQWGDYGYVDTYYDDYGYVDSYYDDYGYVDTYYDDYGYVDTWYDDYDYGYVDTYYDSFYPDTEFYPDTAYYEDDYGYGYDDYSYDYGCGSLCYTTPTYTTPGCSFCGGSNPPRYTPPIVTQPAHSSYTNIVTNNVDNSQDNDNYNYITNIDNSIRDSFNNYNSNNIAIATPQTPIVYTTPAPYCVITHAQYGGYGSSAYLSWTATNATSAYISNIGSVALSGSQTVYTHGTSVYSMTVTGQNGQTATCATTVQGQTYVPPTYSAPYVSLTQIPYTGFDFGPIGNAMYWAGLLGFALAGSYLMIYYRGGALAFATAVAGTRKPLPAVVAPKAPILVEREAQAALAETKVQPVVAAIRKAGTTDTMAIVAVKDGSMPKIVIARN